MMDMSFSLLLGGPGKGEEGGGAWKGLEIMQIAFGYFGGFRMAWKNDASTKAALISANNGKKKQRAGGLGGSRPAPALLVPFLRSPLRKYA